MLFYIMAYVTSSGKHASSGFLLGFSRGVTVNRISDESAG
jgi:hypothetical protein